MLAGHSPAEKEAREKYGLSQLIKEYAHMPGYVDLMLQFENQSTPEARFVRAADKLMVLLIHFPNNAQVLREHYTYDEFNANERALEIRDRYKYGEFDMILELRQELSQILADTFLSQTHDSTNRSETSDEP